jgi:hypothetical protein
MKNIETKLLNQLIDLIKKTEETEKVVVEIVSFDNKEYYVIDLVEELERRSKR